MIWRTLKGWGWATSENRGDTVVQTYTYLYMNRFARYKELALARHALLYTGRFDLLCRERHELCAQEIMSHKNETGQVHPP